MGWKALAKRLRALRRVAGRDACAPSFAGGLPAKKGDKTVGLVSLGVKLLQLEFSLGDLSGVAAAWAERV